jgi:hypothetical protein
VIGRPVIGRAMEGGDVRDPGGEVAARERGELHLEPGGDVHGP